MLKEEAEKDKLNNEIHDAEKFLYYCYPKHIVEKINFKKSKIEREGFYDFHFQEINLALELKQITNNKLFHQKNLPTIKDSLIKADKQLGKELQENNYKIKKILLLVNTYPYLTTIYLETYKRIINTVQSYKFDHINEVYFMYDTSEKNIFCIHNKIKVKVDRIL